VLSSSLIPRVVATSFIALLSLAAISIWSDSQPASFARLHAQDAVAPAAAKTFEYEGLTSCAGCHEKPNAIYERIGSTKFVALNESDTWFKKDKHSKAVELIDPKNSPLGKQMCDKLKIADIHQAKECLSCHANWQYDAKADKWAERPKFHEFGVSCESCHGPASAWKGPHEKPEWRKLSPADKEGFGMVEVRNPVARAKQCLACHVGDASQGKVITHEMYAAGHPPLPGVELETFAYEMPAHWRHVDEKPDFDLRKEFIELNPLATAGGEFRRSRSALLSAVIAMQASLELVSAQVEETKRVPDFAAFDCYSCHHDLKTPAWRQQRTDVGVPGRPHPAIWPTTLIDAAFAFTKSDATAYRKALKDHAAAFDAQPFGSLGKLLPARDALRAQLALLVTDIEKTECDRAAVQRAFDALCKPTENSTLDYDAARQTAWAIKVFAQDLAIAVPDNFAAGLNLKLPSQDAQILNDLPTRMKALSDYDPEAFRKQLKELQK
jgi:hypothetical protein